MNCQIQEGITETPPRFAKTQIARLGCKERSVIELMTLEKLKFRALYAFSSALCVHRALEMKDLRDRGWSLTARALETH